MHVNVCTQTYSDHASDLLTDRQSPTAEFSERRSSLLSQTGNSFISEGSRQGDRVISISCLSPAKFLVGPVMKTFPGGRKPVGSATPTRVACSRLFLLRAALAYCLTTAAGTPGQNNQQQEESQQLFSQVYFVSFSQE